MVWAGHYYVESVTVSCVGNKKLVHLTYDNKVCGAKHRVVHYVPSYLTIIEIDKFVTS